MAWNRYSYVGNDPLAFTDPSGYSRFSNFFRGVGTFFRNLFASPLLRSILQIAATVAATIACGGNVACGMVAAALISGAVTGLSGGKFSEMLRASAMAFMAAVAFNVVGGVSTAIGGTAGFAVKVAGHAGVGCLTAVASGGSCGSGAASAAVSAAATPLVGEVFQNPRGNVSDLIGGTATHAAIGGFASVAGGGKFENGAVTAAFGYLFNEVAHYASTTAAHGRYLYGDPDWQESLANGTVADPTSPWLEMGAAFGGLGRLAQGIMSALNWLSASEWTFGANHSQTRWMNQMRDRGWTEGQITDAIARGQQFPAVNYVNPGNAATRFVNPQTGQSVVRDNVSREIIHIGGPGFRY